MSGYLMEHSIVLNHDANEAIMVPTERKQTKAYLRRYKTWLDNTSRHFLQPDLVAYRDHLLETMKPSSTGVYLSAIRKRYKSIIADRQTFFDYISEITTDETPFHERKAYVDEMIERIKNAIDPEFSMVKQVKYQDRPDSAFIRLSSEQVAELMSLPNASTLRGIRDLAIMALTLATGCRISELRYATVADLRVWFGNELAFHIKHGKGRKERLVPYGDLEWLLGFVDEWLSQAGITQGIVFRRVYKGGKTVGTDPLTTYGLEKILSAYPIMYNGELTVVKPHDLRRTYARRAYDAGMKVYQIQKNMGHQNEETTKGYIGDLSAGERKPPAIYGDIERQLKAIRVS